MRIPFPIPLALGFVLAACSDGADPSEPALESSVTPAAATSWSQVSGGSQHACALTSAGQAFCWGRNGSGELGNGQGGGGTGDESRELTPTPVAGGLVFRQISAGGLRSCGVTTDNIGYCWGDNTLGALGIGAEGHRNLPTRVAGGLRFLQIDAGTRLHACGITTDRRVYCWGYNSQGQLGDGERANIEDAPVPVATTLRFRQVAAGTYHTCAVTTTDRAYCWGDNDRGQIGIGTNRRRRLVPTAVAAGHAFRQVATGLFHSCAVTTAARAYCWGDNLQGAVGDGTTMRRYSPHLVAGGRTFDRVSVGEWHSCGETSGNRPFCWGRNSEGQLGDGTTTSRLMPVAVAGDLVVAQMAAGGFSSYAVSTGTGLYAWGWNPNGQLGDGSTTTRTRPVEVAAAP